MELNIGYINLLLAENQMNKKKLAAAMNISQNYLSVLLKKGTCKPETAFKIATALGCEVSEIIL